MRLMSRLPVRARPSLARQRLFPALMVALAAAAPLHAQAQDQAPVRPTATISMEGRGDISVAPDMAVVTTRVVTTGKQAPEALTANTAAMAEVIAEIRSAGIESKHIQTSGFSIYPRYDHSETAQGQTPLITGYEVSNGVTIQVRDLARLGAILEAVVTNGANSIGGISFEVSEPAEKLDQARKAAVADARRRAELYATAAGVSLGRVLAIIEGGASTPQPYAMRAEKLMMAAAPVPIEAGENTLSASVSITWELTQ